MPRINVFSLALAILCVVLLTDCGGDTNGNTRRETWPAAPKTKKDSLSSANGVRTSSCSGLEKLYSIDLQEMNSYYAKVYVYIGNKDSIYAVNSCVLLKYVNSYKEVISIWYLDKQNFARQYIKAIDDKRISDAQFKKMDQHLVATFEQFKGKEGSWDFNR